MKIALLVLSAPLFRLAAASHNMMQVLPLPKSMASSALNAVATSSWRGLSYGRRSKPLPSGNQICSCFTPLLKYSSSSAQSRARCRPSTALPMSSNYSTWEQITNHKTSKTVKLFKSVHRANKSKRSELGLTVAEGVRLVSDILANEKSRPLVRRIVVSESLMYGDDGVGSEGDGDQYQNQLRHWLEVVDQESRQRKADATETTTMSESCIINVGTDQVVDACSGTVTSQGIVALVDIPPEFNPKETAGLDGDDNDPPPFFLILDGLSDPGNVGTLLRSCAASYVTALILLPGSCDVWNSKVVRSSMGASFRVPVLEISKTSESKEPIEELLDLMETCGVSRDRVYAATMEASGGVESVPHYAIDFARNGRGSAIILGREGEGLRADVRDAIKQGKISTVHVPMAPGMESLNAGVCGSVIMFERMRQLSL